ncbi:tail fiber domain-containing protein [Salmonella enterica subsp. enterica serovar Typhi]|uniref:phage tail protein n=1 Tax=Salmonella enterica TaxID=28901 RepID=UPI0005E2A17D|nr:phage tail protein [Salmonella enterica]CGM21576.1 tail fiber domain-containing protein [Salmonella enterica subsp. enterica serovar Typhi]CGP61281.1 tail fiber domain-containing protein [Salmonella enterica subsp. enterica serovar Typhi]CHT44712.1 tail fiber domain-containing protein [Salmonella enterica subsp. enterica serovar Typhi]CHT81058.1 tail fiber domain-containing protein [Salmonella enterica subsp. enterica serovar Typhi]CIJ85516.1 tail fiber domain-containing protein [Salmonella
MANLPETPQWESGIYQIEVSDPVLGGPDGISNRQAKQLASRTSYLKQKVEKSGTDLAAHIAAVDPHTQYATKASPTFTGTPTAPTPANGDNSKKLATTEFVAKALAALAGSAPETLDTLKELADALGNDPNFATTVLNKLAEKLAKDQNGADIPEPALFVKNLGLGEGSALPVGVPVPWPSATPPAGWLKCNGAAFSSEMYPKLAKAYPANKLPDLRGEFIRGWDDERGIDPGRQLLEWQKGTLVGGRDDNDAAVDISYMSNGNSIDYGGDKTFSTNYRSDYLWYAILGNVTGRAKAALSGSFFNVTRPRNIAFNYIVRAT